MCTALPDISAAQSAEPPPPPPPRVLKHPHGVRALAFSPDGKTLAAVQDDGAVRIWDLLTGKTTATFGGLGEVVRVSAFSPDGKTLAAAGGEGVVRLRDGETGQHVWTLPGDAKVLSFGIDSLAFSPDGKTLAAVGTWDREVQMWDIATRKKTPGFKLALKGDARLVRSVAFSPNGKTLVTGGYDHTMRLWDTASGAQTGTRGGRVGWVTAVAFSPDGRTLASAGAEPDRTIKLWDLDLTK